MYPQRLLVRMRAHAEDFASRIAFLFALFTFVCVAPGAFAQAVQHVTNPYVGAVSYINPDYTAEVQTAIAAQPAGSRLAKQMTVAATFPTGVWLDHIGAIYGGAAAGGRMSLQQHIIAALAQQADTTVNPAGEPIVVELVIYDLPQRNCEALASNGELSIAGGDTVSGPTGAKITLTGPGLQEYENDFIMPIFNILQMFAGNSNIRFVLVVENDSLPNLVTNVGFAPVPVIPACVAANGGVTGQPSLTGVYVQGIQFALSTFHRLPNVYNYLDVAHHGLLGFPSNFTPAVSFLTAVAQGAAGGLASVDGFISNTANYGPTKEPFMTARENIGGNLVMSAAFYQFDPFIDEEDYAAAMDAAFIQAGFPATTGFLIDTSRNGWGSTLRPVEPSTSLDVNAFVNASKIDLRTDKDQWCNQPNTGLGVPPTVNPGGFANLSAYVWMKPPGESDGNYPGSVSNGITSATGDLNCDPTHDNALANGQPTDAVPNSPPAGTFWIPYYTMLVQNALPVVSTGPSGLSIKPQTTNIILTPGGPSVIVPLTISSGSDTAVTFIVSAVAPGISVSFGPKLLSENMVSMAVSAAATTPASTSIMIITATNGTQTVRVDFLVTVLGNESPCHIGYTITNQWNTGFQAALAINNSSTTDINGWTLMWSFANGQTITQLWTGQATQSGANVTVNNLSYDASIPAGGSYNGAGFIATWDGITNSIPTGFALNGIPCN